MRKGVFLLIIAFVLLFFGYFFGSRRGSGPGRTASVEELAQPTAETEVNRAFEFDLGDNMFLKFSLVEAKKVKLIARQGNPITANPGDEFLILSLELENDNDVALAVNNQDFIRRIDDRGKHYAADLYNGQIQVPAISIKKDELAFIVPSNQSNFVFQVGQIQDEEKDEVKIDF